MIRGGNIRIKNGQFDYYGALYHSLYGRRKRILPKRSSRSSGLPEEVTRRPASMRATPHKSAPFRRRLFFAIFLRVIENFFGFLTEIFNAGKTKNEFWPLSYILIPPFPSAPYARFYELLRGATIFGPIPRPPWSSYGQLAPRK